MGGGCGDQAGDKLPCGGGQSASSAVSCDGRVYDTASRMNLEHQPDKHKSVQALKPIEPPFTAVTVPCVMLKAAYRTERQLAVRVPPSGQTGSRAGIPPFPDADKTQQQCQRLCRSCC